LGTRSGASDLARLASAIKGQQLREAAVDYARCLATVFVLACCVVGAALGALVVLVRCGVETIGGWRQ
jgi:multisubunit Na+/H+ antiporter MnhC subunit